MQSKLIEAVGALINASAGVRIRLPAPDDELIDSYESQMEITFGDEYRYFLKNASTIYFGNIEPLVLSRDINSRGDLLQAIKIARRLGVPFKWLPVCEDNGDYYCLDQTGNIRFWSGDGVSSESWPTLADWIIYVWIGGN